MRFWDIIDGRFFEHCIDNSFEFPKKHIHPPAKHLINEHLLLNSYDSYCRLRRTSCNRYIYDDPRPEHGRNRAQSPDGRDRESAVASSPDKNSVRNICRFSCLPGRAHKTAFRCRNPDRRMLDVFRGRGSQHPFRVLRFSGVV